MLLLHGPRVLWAIHGKLFSLAMPFRLVEVVRRDGMHRFLGALEFLQSLIQRSKIVIVMSSSPKKMTPMKIIVYVLVIAIIILGLLLSMLNLERTGFIVAKWSVCGILSVIVVGISLVNLQLFPKIAQYRISIRLAIRVLATPLLVLVLAAVIFALMGKDDLSEKILLQAPFLPVFLVFFASIAVHLTYAYLRRSKD